MKKMNNLRNSVIASAVTLALLGLVSFSAAGAPQLKGAEVLVKRTRSDQTATTAVTKNTENVGMSCAKCKDHYIKVAQPPGKMGRREMATVSRHDCSTCESKVVITGHGKGKRETVVHVCNAGIVDAAACCAVVKN